MRCNGRPDRAGPASHPREREGGGQDGWPFVEDVHQPESGAGRPAGRPLFPVRTPLATRRRPSVTMRPRARAPRSGLAAGGLTATGRRECGHRSTRRPPERRRTVRLGRRRPLHPADGRRPGSRRPLDAGSRHRHDPRRTGMGRYRNPGGERLAQPDPLDVLAAQAIVDELAERTPCRWGRQHTDAVRAALHRTLADLADVLLEASESTPTLLDWTAHDGGWRASAVIGGVIHHVALQKGEHSPSAAQPVWHRTRPSVARIAWQWRITNGPTGRTSHDCGPIPSALAARHAAECAITALAAGRCSL